MKPQIQEQTTTTKKKRGSPKTGIGKNKSQLKPYAMAKNFKKINYMNVTKSNANKNSAIHESRNQTDVTVLRSNGMDEADINPNSIPN